MRIATSETIVSGHGRQVSQMWTKNHFSRMCRTRVSSKRPATKQVIHNIDEESSDEDTTNLYVDTITKTKAKQNDEW